MKFLLIVHIMQSGLSTIFFTPFSTLKECRKDRIETVKWQNGNTKARAYCVKIEK